MGLSFWVIRRPQGGFFLLFIYLLNLFNFKGVSENLVLKQKVVPSFHIFFLKKKLLTEGVLFYKEWYFHKYDLIDLWSLMGSENNL